MRPHHFAGTGKIKGPRQVIAENLARVSGEMSGAALARRGTRKRSHFNESMNGRFLQPCRCEAHDAAVGGTDLFGVVAGVRAGPQRRAS